MPILPPRRHPRVATGLLLWAAMTLVVGLGAACSSDSGTEEPAPDETSTTVPAGPEAAVSQRRPEAMNGLALVDDDLWIADNTGGEILRVELASGEILARYGAEAGVEGPDDLAADGDGHLFWTSFTTGDIGRLDPATGATDNLGNIGPGANAITFHDGRLLVTRAVTADGLWEVDPTGASPPREITPTLGNVNGFDVGPDGLLWGPAYDQTDGTGRLVTIDPATGVVTEVLPWSGFPTAVKVADDGIVYVVSVPARLDRFDPATSTLEAVAVPATDAVDNLVVAEDGTVIISGFLGNTLSIVDPDTGEVTTRTVGS